jgi:hypothetical protein
MEESRMNQEPFSRRSFISLASAAAAGSSLPWLRAQAQDAPARKWVFAVQDFSRGSGGWLPGFSDFSLATSPPERLAEIRRLPPEIDENRFGYYLQARNTSDDVFMFLKKQLTPAEGVQGDSTYDVEYFIEFASNAPTGCVGICGAPGESAWLKAGASRDEPIALLQDGYVQLNVDKGNQAVGGQDAEIVSDIANGRPCEPPLPGPYILLQRYHRHPNPVTTDITGNLWLFLGTDSGFEGTTGLYYATINVLLTRRDP